MIEIEEHGHARVLRLARPAVRNALSTALLAALLEELDAAVGDAGVRVLVLCGAGGTFSAGADLREDLDHDGLVRRTDLFAQVYAALGAFPKTTVAAVQGHCVGGGAEIAAACDLRVADASAAFRFPGAALGFPVGAAKLVGLVGLGTAKDLVLTSRTVAADEAYRIGLVQRLTEPGAALDEALAIAAAVAAHHPDAVAQLKRMFARFSGLADRIAVENDALRALAEAGGDYGALTMPDPKRGWPKA